MDEKDKKEIPRDNGFPVHLRLLDIYLEQVEQSATLLSAMVKDMQSVYIQSVKFSLKTGEMIENKSNANGIFFKAAGSAFDSIMKIYSETQNDVTRAAENSVIQSVRMIRKNITGR